MHSELTTDVDASDAPLSGGIPFLRGIRDASGLRTFRLQWNGAQCDWIVRNLTTASDQWLDGKHVVFGKVLDAVSMMVVHKIEAVQAGSDNKPKLPVLISQCGEL